MIRQIQNSFIGGELDPAIWGRQDIKRYYECAAVIQNFVVQRAGGITKRPGTDLIDEVTGIANWDVDTPLSPGVKLIRFRKDRSNAYLLVMVDKKIYFYKDGIAVLKDGQPYYITTPYEPQDLDKVRHQQCGDTIFITHQSYPPMKLFCEDDTGTYWTLSTISFQISVSSPTWSGGGTVNGVVTANVPTGFAFTGTAAHYTVQATPVPTTGFTLYRYAVSAVVDGQESVPSTPVSALISSPWYDGDSVTLTWGTVTGASYYSVYKLMFGSYGLIGSINTNSFTVSSNNGTLITINNNYNYGISSVGGQTGHYRYWSTYYQPGYQYNASFNLFGTEVDKVSGTDPYNTQYNVLYTKSVTAAPIIPQTGSIMLSFSTTASVSGVSIAFGAKALKTDGTVEEIGFGADYFEVWGNNTSGVATFPGSWTKIFTSSGIADGAQPGLLKFTWKSVSFQYMAITWPSSPTAVHCLRAIQWVSPVILNFTDINISPDTSFAPTSAQSPWTEDTGYPGTMTLFEQRSVWSRIPTSLSEILFSAVGNLYAFNKSVPQRATDQIDAFMSITEPGEILHLVPLKNTLIVLTESGEWVMAYDTGSGLSFSTIRLDQHTYFGCNKTPPLKIANGLVFCHRDGRSLMEYNLQLYTIDNFTAIDRSILSRHLTEKSQITSTAYQLAPDSVVWCRLSDGTMISMTYVPAENVFSWARHLTGDPDSPDIIIDVVSTESLVQKADGITTADTITDEVYMLVERNKRLYVERMRVNISEDTPLVGDAVCMDACQRLYLSVPTTVLTPPVALADNTLCTVVNVEDGTSQVGTWLNGSITVVTPVQYCIIGIPITSQLITLYPDQQQSNIQNIHKNIKTVAIRQRRGLGGTIGPYGSETNPVNTDEMPFINDDEVVDQAPVGGIPDGTVHLNTRDIRVPLQGSWNREGQLSITHDSHWPITILSLMYQLDHGEPNL